MKISGFTMVKNVSKLYYPIKASIESILPICDEFIIALGDCDDDDDTREIIESIGSDKIRIIDTVWDTDKYQGGTVYAQQTDFAKSHCKGDWLFYIQADEVIHEKYLPVIKSRCEELVDDEDIEALLFKYIHFWGDYNHYNLTHSWYPKEIRLVKNQKDIHSWRDAQSFRRIPNFDGVNHKQEEGTYKLKCALIDAYVYHYGWVRPPSYMQKKKRAFSSVYIGKKKANEIYDSQSDEFDYGPLKYAEIFEGTHPKLMDEWISQMNWQDKLRQDGAYPANRPKTKHEKIKYKIVTWIEQKILGGRMIGGFKNYILLKK
ncbi:MAG: hypothetical protein HRT66_12805 [Flavobacteriaceae bacterium]|nr:hypothetical protein [Flavobacteriaceae bacterium]